MAEIRSISQAAKRFNISRPRLSKLIKEFGIRKIKCGTTYQVDMEDLNRMFCDLKKRGRTRKKDLQVIDMPPATSKIEQLQHQIEDLRLQLAAVRPLSTQQGYRRQPLAFGRWLRDLFAPWG